MTVGGIRNRVDSTGIFLFLIFFVADWLDTRIDNQPSVGKDTLCKSKKGKSANQTKHEPHKERRTLVEPEACHRRKENCSCWRSLEDFEAEHFVSPTTSLLPPKL